MALTISLATWPPNQIFTNYKHYRIQQLFQVPVLKVREINLHTSPQGQNQSCSPDKLVNHELQNPIVAITNSRQVQRFSTTTSYTFTQCSSTTYWNVQRPKKLKKKTLENQLTQSNLFTTVTKISPPGIPWMHAPQENPPHLLLHLSTHVNYQSKVAN